MVRMAEDVELDATQQISNDQSMRDEGSTRTGKESSFGKSESGSGPRRNDALEDKVYEEIRGHERHIMFHFFTLFSISFICGVVLIHLSLLMNSYVHAIMYHMNSYDVSNNEMNLHDNYGAHKETQIFYSSVYTQDETIKEIFTSPFYYTGIYFKHNTTVDTRVLFYSKSFNTTIE